MHSSLGMTSKYNKISSNMSFTANCQQCTYGRHVLVRGGFLEALRDWPFQVNILGPQIWPWDCKLSCQDHRNIHAAFLILHYCVFPLIVSTRITFSCDALVMSLCRRLWEGWLTLHSPKVHPRQRLSRDQMKLKLLRAAISTFTCASDLWLKLGMGYT